MAYLQEKEEEKKNSHKDNLQKSRVTPYKNKSPQTHQNIRIFLETSCNLGLKRSKPHFVSFYLENSFCLTGMLQHLFEISTLKT